jgi:hypothetical protein
MRRRRRTDDGDMAERVVLLTFQFALLACSRRYRDSIRELLRALSTALHGRRIKPWQVRAYRRAALVVLGLTVVYDAVYLPGLL